jgi:phosphatidylserine synthase
MKTLLLLTVSFKMTSNLRREMFCNFSLKSIFSVQFLGIILIYHVQNYIFLDVINKYEILYLPYFHLLCIT